MDGSKNCRSIHYKTLTIMFGIRKLKSPYLNSKLSGSPGPRTVFPRLRLSHGRARPFFASVHPRAWCVYSAVPLPPGRQLVGGRRCHPRSALEPRVPPARARLSPFLSASEKKATRIIITSLYNFETTVFQSLGYDNITKKIKDGTVSKKAPLYMSSWERSSCYKQ